MARVPGGGDVGRVAAPRDPGARLRQPSGVLNEVAQLGQNIAEIGAAFAEREEKNQASSGFLAAARDLTALETEITAGDHTGANERFRAGSQQILARYKSQLGARVFGRMSSRLATSLLGAERRVTRFQQRRIAQATVGLAHDEAVAINQAFRDAGDDRESLTEASTRLLEFRNQLDVDIADGAFTAKDAGELFRDTESDAAKTVIAGHLSREIEAGRYFETIQQLKSGDIDDPLIKRLWNDIDPDERATLVRDTSRILKLANDAEDRRANQETDRIEALNDETFRAFTVAPTRAEKSAILNQAVRNRDIAGDTIEDMRTALDKFGTGIATDPDVLRDTITLIANGRITREGQLPAELDDDDRKTAIQMILARRRQQHVTQSVRFGAADRRLRLTLGIPDKGFAILDSKARQAMARYGEARIKLQDAAFAADKAGTVPADPERPGVGEFDPLQFAKDLIETELKPQRGEDAERQARIEEIDAALAKLRSDDSLSSRQRKERREALAAERAKLLSETLGGGE